MSQPQLSVVVPVFNERDNVTPLIEEITAALRGQVVFEIVYVDDHSRDDTLAVLQGLKADETVAVQGAGFLNEGDLVKVVDEATDADVDALYDEFTPMNAGSVKQHATLILGAADMVARLRAAGVDTLEGYVATLGKSTRAQLQRSLRLYAQRGPLRLERATTAIFYSISNTQPGLRGVSFGDSLIKQVVETLHQEFPRLKTFATLSPIPGLRGWLMKNAPAELLKAWERVAEMPENAPERRALLGWAARYLGAELQDGKPVDPVARFHLGNGACVERLNWAADPSAKGLKQSYGLMVNYLYDLKRLDKHRAMLAQAKIPTARAIKDLYL